MADTLTFYQSKRLVGSKQWRWRYQAEGNMEKMANGGESYGNLIDAVKGAYRVCGISDDPNALVASASSYVSVIRPDGSDLQIRVR